MTQSSAKSTSIKIVTIATSWGSTHGGVNSFNYDFTVEIARQVQAGVVACVVPSASEAEREDASRQNVSLISIASDSNLDMDVSWANLVLLSTNFNEVEYWIGHDIITGEFALALKKASASGQVAAIMHQSYMDYASVKHPDRGSMVYKARQQENVFSSVDYAFAVGPLLRNRLRDLCGSEEMLVPGLVPLDLKKFHSTLTVLVFGRLSQDNTLLKGTTLACDAVAEAVKVVMKAGIENTILSSTNLKLIGVEQADEEARKIKKRVEKKANRCVSVDLLPFLTRTELVNEMEGANLVLMLSWHEGFGLVGWEAIAAGIPLILSKNSGLYKLLEENGGPATGCVHSVDVHGSIDHDYRNEDLEEVRMAITKVATNLDSALQNAQYLRNLLMNQKGYTWSATVRHFLLKTGATYLLKEQHKNDTQVTSHGAYVGFTQGFDSARVSEKLKIASVFYETGYYEKALNEIRSTGKCQDPLTDSQASDCKLLECEILLRLNQHEEVLVEVVKLLEWFRPRAEWAKVIKTNGLKNTVQRDLGRYEEAVVSARDNLVIAQQFSLQDIGKVSRDLARSLALIEDNTAVSVAKDAINYSQDGLDKAKAYLALGEAYRHIKFQIDAIDAYLESIRWAEAAGHYDCLLWASLGLADSYFLKDDLTAMAEPLSTIGRIISDRDRVFPLEALHYEISVASAAFRRTKSSATFEELSYIAEKYIAMGVHWPEIYIEEILSGNFSSAKKF